MTISLASAAARPMRGRLVRSRSPPQPKTVRTRPLLRHDKITRQRKYIAQRIVRVCVVHHNRERLPRIDSFKAPRNSMQLRRGFCDLFQRQSTRHRRGARRKQIQDIHAACQRDFDGRLALLRHQRESHPVRPHHDVTRAQIATVDPIAHNLEIPRPALFRQAQPACRPRHSEQPPAAPLACDPSKSFRFAAKYASIVP